MSISSLTSYGFTGTRTGSFTNNKGTGTYSATNIDSEDKKTRTSQVELTYADGTTVTRDRTVVKNEDGTKTVTATAVGADGQTVSRNLTIVKNEDGTKSITGTYTQADGTVDSVTGTRGNGAASFTLTNPDGEVATRERTRTMNEDGSVTYNATGTNFNGKSISRTSTWSIDA